MSEDDMPSRRRFLRALGWVIVLGGAACSPPNTSVVIQRDICHLGQATPGVRTVSWRELADDPVAFEGRTVRIVGRLHLQFENYSLTAPNARSGPFWVDLGNAIDADLATKACAGVLIAFEGELDLERHGHMGMSVGTLVAKRIDALDDDEPDPLVPSTPPMTAMDEHVVTVADYEACVRAGRCKAAAGKPAMTAGCNSGRSDRGAFPMNCVRWVDAARYCAWSGKRLPTEQEWFSGLGLESPAEVRVLPRASTVLSAYAETHAVEDAHRVVTNGVAEWTRSPVRSKNCLEFDRVIVRDPGIGEPLRVHGSVNGFATQSADLGFRCAR